MIAALAAWHEAHEAAAEALSAVTALPAHVVLEVYAVLTRLPSGLAVPAAAAADALRARFPARPLRLDDRDSVIATLADFGVFGSASYDGLVALEAAAHGEVLLTLDARARATYQRLGVGFQVIT